MMEEEFWLIVDVKVVVGLMLVCMGVEEGNMFERGGMNVSSWFDIVVFYRFGGNIGIK